MEVCGLAVARGWWGWVEGRRQAGARRGQCSRYA